MIQMKFKQLATVGVCCSMLANSLAGVTAVAETMTVESSPTVESTKENTKETESQANKTEESTAKVKVNKEEAVSEKQEITKKFNYGESLLQPKQISPKATMNFPQLTYQFGFIDETGMRVDASTVHLAYDIWVGESLLRGDWKTLSIEKGRLATTNNNLKEIVYPKQSLNQVSGRDWQYSAANLTFIPPRYYEKMSVYNKNGTFDTAYSFPNINSYNGISSTVHTENDTKNLSRYFELTKSGNQSFIFNESTSAAPADVKVPAYLRETVVDPDNGYLGYGVYDGLDKPVYYYLTNRKVTENFVDATGAKITPPTGFTQGKQTVINSDPYIFKQSGTLPDTYTAGDKTYKFKGWYKGTDATKMETTKTPRYAVTYDDNDDLNVIYEEVVPKTVTVPAVDYLFGFINEKGVYDYDAKLTATITEVSGGTVKNGSAITSVPEGVFQKLTIPSKTLTYTETSPTYYGVTKANVQVPKYYKQPTVKPGSYFTGPVGGYPMATIALQNIANGQKSNASVDGSRFDVVPNESAKPNNYLLVSNSWANDTTKTAFSKALSMTTTVNAPSFFTTEDKMFYFLENRRVTENFVDSNGAKITPPTGFTQGKKTVIDSNDFTYTSDKALPATYSADGKSYRLKGWYKGKDKPPTLSTGTPTYKVTYDDNDDLTVVYDEAKVTLPGYTYQFGFVDEAGQLINPELVNLTYDMWFFEDKIETILEKSVKATNSGDLKEMTIADKVVKEPTAETLGENTIYSPINIQFTLPKYYETIVASEGSDTNYPLPQMIQNASGRESNVVATKDTFALKKLTDQTFGMQTLFTNSLVPDTPYPIPFRRYTKWAGGTVPVNTTYMKVMSPVYYMVKNRRVTESFVDATGAKITPPTGFTQGKQIVIDSDNFTYTSAKALPTSYTADGKTYLFQGWYKGKTKPNTLTTSTTPTYDTTFDDNDDMTAVYKEASISANLTMRGAVDVIDNGATMEYWEVLLKNTGEAPLTSIKIKPTTEWVAGISAPTNLFILGTGQNAKSPKITKEQWEAGFEIPLDKSLPVGGQLTINLIGTKVTGQPNQVLKAAVEVTGDFSNLSASDTVRIKDLDQETKEPTGEGFISVPTFDFGQVGVASATKQHGLKKAADYYGNGTRNPYVRIKKTQPNWSLTAQLSQPKSVTDSLPTATRLLLGAAPVSSFSNYNQPTELKNAIGTTNAIHLTANNAATSIIANQQFTGSDVYQLDFTFDNIKLEVPANQGTAGQQYQAAVTWNLVTGP